MKCRNKVVMVVVFVFMARSVLQSWAQYTLIDLGDLFGGGGYSVALGVNDIGQVIGHSDIATGTQAFLWQADTGMIDVNDLLGSDAAGWTLLEANDINNNGWIVGSGINPDGQVHAFLLVSEPTMLVLLGLGGAAALRRSRR